MNNLKIPQVSAELFIGQKQVYPFNFTNSFAANDSIANVSDVTVTVTPTGSGVTTGIAVSGKIAQITVDATGVAIAENSRELLIEVRAVASPSTLSDLIPMKLTLVGKYKGT